MSDWEFLSDNSKEDINEAAQGHFNKIVNL